MGNSVAFHGPNAGYVLELYERFLDDPESVSPETRRFLESWTPAEIEGPRGDTTTAEASKIIAVASYVNAIRRHGHLAANLSPFASPVDELPEELRPETYDLTDADLQNLPASAVQIRDGHAHANALEAIRHLQQVYSGSIAYEFLHIMDPTERYWLREAAESNQYLEPLDAERKQAILKRLTDIEALETFLHTAYLGQKRFSVEGTDMIVPMLDQLIEDADQAGIGGIVIGMAHRGRLNVLAHVLGKPYDAIISEFEHLPHNASNGVSDGVTARYTGDVKYHLGWEKRGDGDDLPIVLSPNPSHLEWVDPVVEGMARAHQDRRDEPGLPEQDINACLPILLHGDAAFPGQGIVSETLNLARLPGYRTGGTIHIITNNQIGFTTDPNAGRSTLYASDLAKGFEIPIVHVNADDPVACLAAVRMAMDYRQQFNSDFLIDLIGYRRWGHNEGDEPSFTQPEMYAHIHAHPTVRKRWAGYLEGDQVISEGQGEQLLNQQLDELQDVRDRLRANADAHQPNGHRPGEQSLAFETEVSPDLLNTFNDAIHNFPEGFTINSKLRRQLERRRGALEQEGGIDWAHGESLALASILAEGVPVRFTGQDSERGTFSQRHLVLHDPETGNTLSLLQALPEALASFVVYNSPLSEPGVLGFEYGYSIAAPEALVIWEAQFGDFANSAQVIIDQFIASSGAKWSQRAGLVLLLPHGYEGQGPEHSSARLERFLQLAANDNLRIANLTTSAQYFHILRRQAKLLQSDPAPLVIMTPKSLLRHPRAGSSLIDLAGGSFQPVIDDETAAERLGKVTRAVLCSGKIYVDLSTSDAFAETQNAAVIRVEELFPFPEQQLRATLDRYPNLQELVWLQEEPRNMGAWNFMEPRLRDLVDDRIPVRYIGRSLEASPAEGSGDDHSAEQRRIVHAAFATAAVLEGSLADD